MKRILSFTLLLLFSVFLVSCNKTGDANWFDATNKTEVKNLKFEDIEKLLENLTFDYENVLIEGTLNQESESFSEDKETNYEYKRTRIESFDLALKLYLEKSGNTIFDVSLEMEEEYDYIDLSGNFSNSYHELMNLEGTAYLDASKKMFYLNVLATEEDLVNKTKEVHKDDKISVSLKLSDIIVDFLIVQLGFNSTEELIDALLGGFDTFDEFERIVKDAVAELKVELGDMFEELEEVMDKDEFREVETIVYAKHAKLTTATNKFLADLKALNLESGNINANDARDVMRIFDQLLDKIENIVVELVDEVIDLDLLDDFDFEDIEKDEEFEMLEEFLSSDEFKQLIISYPGLKLHTKGKASMLVIDVDKTLIEQYIKVLKALDINLKKFDIELDDLITYLEMIIEEEDETLLKGTFELLIANNTISSMKISLDVTTNYTYSYNKFSRDDTSRFIIELVMSFDVKEQKAPNVRGYRFVRFNELLEFFD